MRSSPRDVGYKTFALSPQVDKFDGLHSAFAPQHPLSEPEKILLWFSVGMNLHPPLYAIAAGNLTYYQ